ncbi:MAG: cation:proton antiporter subunit C [Defluviitaleaceae bacterium]|nr:cation:proton antiporter subunit C [Defluviitaleaceae bacterium]
MRLDIFTMVMFFVSFFGLITSRTIIKSIVFILIMQTSVVMFWLIVGNMHGSLPPIDVYNIDAENISDPLPQALMLSAIVIGISVITVSITMFNNLFRKYETASWDHMEKVYSNEGEGEQ